MQAPGISFLRNSCSVSKKKIIKSHIKYALQFLFSYINFPSHQNKNVKKVIKFSLHNRLFNKIWWNSFTCMKKITVDEKTFDKDTNRQVTALLERDKTCVVTGKVT